MLRKILVLGALLALTCASIAQPGFGGGQGGPGGRRGGMRMFGGMAMPPSMLLQRDDVQADLKLTTEQKDKLTDIQEKARDEMRAQFQSGTRPDRETMRKNMEKMQEKITKEVNTVLTADQQKRLKQIAIQVNGSNSLLQKDVQKDLGLTAEQIAKIDSLQKGLQDASQKLMAKVQSQELTFQEVMPKMEANGKVFKENLEKVMTDAQKAKLKELGGEPFKSDDDEQPK